jgi:outer membrane protein insertion porin family
VREDNIFDIQPTASRFIQDQAGDFITSMVSQDLAYDKLDNRLEPTTGYFLAVGTDFAGLGGDIKFFRMRGRASYYIPISAPEWVLGFRLETGFVEGLGQTFGTNTPDQTVRINDRFFPGGDNFRGFRLGGAGPRDVTSGDALGGRRYYVGTAELTVPLGLPKELGITGRVFTDAGMSTDSGLPEFDALGNRLVRDSGNIRASAGVGLSWKSPFGPIRIDVAQPYIKDQGDVKELFRFGFGTRF